MSLSHYIVLFIAFILHTRRNNTLGMGSIFVQGHVDLVVLILTECEELKNVPYRGIFETRNLITSVTGIPLSWLGVQL